MDSGRKTHWENVYQTKGERDVSWFQESPAISLELICATGVAGDSPIIDVGGGASRLVDVLIDAAFKKIAVLDLSERALALSRARLGIRGENVSWICADIMSWQPETTYDVWHDRAVFHFLTKPEERAAYAACVVRAVDPGGHVIIGTFAPDGPERCSGLPVQRHDAASLGVVLGPKFKVIDSRRHDHHTPGGATQHFQFSRFRRVN